MIELVKPTAAKKIFKIDSENIAIQERMYANEDHFKLINFYLNNCSYQISTIYEQMNALEKFKSFSYDIAEQTLVIMYQIQSEYDKKRFIKIVDLKTEDILFNHQITNKHLIGRLKCDIYSIVNGHIYFNNSVIKIRYDLLRRDNKNRILEHEAFDYYYDLIDLDKNEEIQLFLPEVSLDSHKMVYMTQSANSHKIADHYQDH